MDADRARAIHAALHTDARVYDTLTPADQRLVRAVWQARMDRALAVTDIAADRHAAGLPTATLDEHGQVVIVHPDGSTTSP